MENLNGLHSGVPRGAKTRREAPLLPLLRHQNTRFRPIQLFTKQFQRNCLINDWKAPRLWFGDTKDALIGLLGLALATHETPEYGLFRFIRQFLNLILGNSEGI